MALQHLRSSTANKRPLPANMADGQVAVNTNTSSPGLFVKDSASGLLKIGPTHIGTTAPNLSPASGGASGNTIGEQWLDTSGTNPLLKVWDGSAWRTIQPVTTGTVVSTTDVGTITSAMILDETIADVDISTTASIAHSKLASITAGRVLLGNSSNVPTATVVSGDITITSAGATTISNGAITNAKISASAGIVDTKLATIATAGKVSNSATTATNGNVASAIVARDASGNFSAGTISAAFIGNLSGTASAIADNTVTSAKIVDGAIVNADINASAAIVDTKLATISTAGKVSNSATTATNGNVVNTIVSRDASGNFSAGTISAALNGNATTATTLATARNINGTSFNGSANITTTEWGTLRNLTIGNTVRSVNGSTNYSWSLSDIGALPAAGGTATGAISAPSFIPTGSTVPTNGLYLPAANSVAISTNGTGRLLVDASGRVGINTAAPNTALHVSGGAELGAFNTTTLPASSGGGGAFFSWNRSSGNAETNICNLFNNAGLSFEFLQKTGASTASVLSRIGTSDHIFYISNTERMRLGSSGRLGLGTSSPVNLLHVQGDATFDSGSGGQFAIRGSTSTSNRLNFGFETTNNYAWIQSITAGTAFRPIALNPSGGNVGIGITSPAYPLEVAKGNGIIGLIPDAANGNAIRFGGVGANANQLIFRGPGDTERARIDGSGRLLVGTSSARFVGSSALSGVLSLEHGAGFLGLSSARNSADNVGSTLALGKSRGITAGAFTIVNANDILGQIRFAGADGVNLQSQGAAISAIVDGTPGAGDMPGRLVFSTTAAGASTPTERMRLSSDGTITTNGAFSTIASGTVDGVAVQTANDTLVISRSAGAGLQIRRRTSDGVSVEFRRDTTLVGTISVTATNTAYNTSSDYRLKENLVPLTGAIDRLQQIPVHRFNFIADPDTVVDGFIAHEAQAVVPECVTGTKDEVDEDGNPVYQGIDQSKIVPLVVAALQEAITRIQALEAEVTALKGA
jgi:hypothetical protein